MRIVFAAAEGAGDLGVPDLSIAAIVARSGVGRRTFYELFRSREDCLLAVFEEGVRRAADVLAPAYSSTEGGYAARLRAGLHALLVFLDEERELGGFCVVGALGAGELVLARRREALAALVSTVDRLRGESRGGTGPSLLTAEGVVGAVLSILHARLLEQRRAPLVGLENELMSIVVRPYLGAGASAAELRRPVRDGPTPPAGSPAAPPAEDARRWPHLRIRWTQRTIAALEAVAAAPGSSNVQLAQAVGIGDPGQASKLLGRLERVGLIETAPARRGAANAWRLT
ncbi:MAG: TetR family transcriptional regulator, partial [Solirubrobacteraceae bacterium]